MATENPQQNVQQTLTNLGQNKRMVFVGAGVVGVVITLIIVFMVWNKGASLGEQISLVKGIDQGRAFEIVSKLKSQDIDSKIIDSDLPGKVIVQVYEKHFDQAALVLSRSDLLQEEGFNLFDKTDWAASDYDKRIKKTRAINGDLSRIVSRMSGVKWATVRISIPEQQLFQQYETPTKATVQVEPDEEGKLSKAQVKSVINLLAGYVPDLKKENISIVDTSGLTYSSVEGNSLATSELMEETEKVNKTIQKRIEEYLGPLLGSSNFIVRVSSEISREKVERSATTFTKGAVGQEQIGDERLGNGGGAAVAVGPQAPSKTGKGYTRSNRVTQNYPSYTQENKSTLPGKISKVSVAVAINRGVPPSVSIKQLQEGIAAIASPDTSSEDVKITVAEFVGAGGRKTTTTRKTVNRIVKEGQTTGVFAGVSSIANQATEAFNGFPLWGKIVTGLIGLIIFLNVFGGMVRPPARAQQQQQSTISQINQAKRQAPQQDIKQIPEGVSQEAIAELPQNQQAAPQPDLSGMLSGLQEAAVEKPEFVANKLQLWVEEGSAL